MHSCSVRAQSVKTKCITCSNVNELITLCVAEWMPHASHILYIHTFSIKRLVNLYELNIFGKQRIRDKNWCASIFVRKSSRKRLSAMMKIEGRWRHCWESFTIFIRVHTCVSACHSNTATLTLMHTAHIMASHVNTSKCVNRWSTNPFAILQMF